MKIVPYDRSLAEAVARAHSLAFDGVPHCYPVGAAEIDAAVSQTIDGPNELVNVGGRIAHPRIPLTEGAALIAVDRGRVVGFCHGAVGYSKPDYDPASPVERAGGIRALFFDRGERAAGAALLDAVETHLRSAGVVRIDAFHFDHRLPFYHVEHACLSTRLEHVHALLGSRGYAAAESQVNLDWPSFVATDPGPTPIPIDIQLEWTQGAGSRPGLIVRAVEIVPTVREVGICVNLCVGDGTPAPDAQDWAYTAWLHVAEEMRARGLGRYLMVRALRELREVGYRHASIRSISWNYRALLLYSSLGYHSVDWTTFWRKRPGGNDCEHEPLVPTAGGELERGTPGRQRPTRGDGLRRRRA
jgi:GNAT superfamily N-acetyltransferase